ncbi:MAG: DUF2283 domain-containing protein [Patescibacteria group bacterium]
MKKKTNPKISYDSDADVLSMESGGHAVIDHVEEMGDLVVHLSKQGKSVLVELIEASQHFKNQPELSRSMTDFLESEPDLYSTADLKERYV